VPSIGDELRNLKYINRKLKLEDRKLSDLMEGLNLMLTGMGIVFLFLVILVIMMKLIPIISRKREKEYLSVPVEQVRKEPPVAQKVQPEPRSEDQDLRDRARTVAAIAAAITATMGRTPKKLIVTTPSGETTSVYNGSWSHAGRQDLMEVGNLQGQRSFEW
jgi:sodium pump decarboxylase gamma subunit